MSLILGMPPLSIHGMPNELQRNFSGRRYLAKSAAERLRPEYKDLSKSIGALASKLRSQQ
jgi:hypothetical protein